MVICSWLENRERITVNGYCFPRKLFQTKRINTIDKIGFSDNIFPEFHSFCFYKDGFLAPQLHHLLSNFG